MKLSRTELRILAEIANGNKEISVIAKALKKSKVQVYRSGRKLIDKGFILLSNGHYEAAKATHVNLFLQLLGEYPSICEPLSGSGIKILTALLEPMGIAGIMQETGTKRTQVFKKIEQARAISLAIYEKGRYSLNGRIWGKAVDFLKELKKYEETTDPRVPAESRIYFKNEKEIVFSSKEELDAALTGFSAYGQYGIKLLMGVNYYYLPKKKLSEEEVFRHSLVIAEKDFETRQIILVALFHAKYRKDLQEIRHHILENIEKILEGQKIPGYPTLQEIRDRAETYDIRL